MKLPKKRYLAVGVIALLLLAGVFFANRGESTVYVTEQAAQTTLRKTVDVTGELKSVTDLDLAFGASGQVGAVPVKIGQVVKEGQVLMSLSRDAEAADVARAEQSLEEVEAALTLKLTGASKEEIATVKASLDAALATFDLADDEFAATQAYGAAQIADAEAALQQAIASQTSSRPIARVSIGAAGRDAVINIRNGIAKADEILGIENSLANTEFKTYLGNEDPNTVDRAGYAFAEAVRARDAAEDAVLALSADPTSAEVLAGSAKIRDAFVKTATLLTYTARVLDATVADSRELSLADIVAFKSSIAGARSALSADEAAFLNAQLSYETDMRDDAVVNAQNALEATRASVALNNAKAESAYENARATVAIRQAEYDKLVAKPRGVDVAGLEAQVRRARADYEAALARFNDGQIVAPADGKVTDIVFDRGERASVGAVAVTMVAADDLFEVEVDIPESDVADVRIGQPATMTFDAFGEGRVFNAAVIELDPAAKTIEGVVYYRATLLLDDEQDVAGLKPGLSADVTITVTEKVDVVVVPQRAVLKREDGTSYVRVMTGASSYDERAVQVGARGDDGLVEIVDGVDAGTDVLVLTKTKK